MRREPVTTLFLLFSLVGAVFGGSDAVENEGATDLASEAPGEELFDDGLDELLEGGAATEIGESEARDSNSPLTGLKGFVSLEPRIYLSDRDDGKNDEQLLFEAELELDFRFHESVSGYFRPRVFVDTLDGDLKRFEPLEAYLTYERETWDLRAGQLVENWGIVDTYNPIDVVNRRDFATDFLDPDRLGEFGARLRLLFAGNETIGEPTASFYVLPVWRETLFPPENQRFSFDSDVAEFDENDGFEPSGIEERGFVGARFQHTLTTRPVNADLQYLVARGPGRTPSLAFAADGDLVPVYFGETTAGLGFRAVPNEDVLGQFLSTFTLKTEVVYRRPYRFSGSPISRPDDYVAYVAGVDREFYDVIVDQDQLTATVEYTGEEGADDPAARLRPFENDIVLRFLWEANDFARSSVELRGIFDFDSSEVIAELVAERQLRFIHEDLKLRIQAQVFDPPETGRSLFDFFPNNSSIAVALRWEF